MNIKARFKHLGFWIGVLGMIGTAFGITLANFTTWPDLGIAIWEAFKNPALVIPMLMTLYGIMVDNSTTGFRDANPAGEAELSNGEEDEQ